MALSDTQSILLVTAAGRTDGSLLPLPGSLKPSGGTGKALAALIKKGFAQERPVDALSLAYRSEGDAQHGIFITVEGGAAISLEPDQLAGIGVAPSQAGAMAPQPPQGDKKQTKVAVVIGLMQRPAGATLAELVEATGWLPHTTRAALTGLRKKGHAVTRIKRDGVTAYTVARQA